MESIYDEALEIYQQLPVSGVYRLLWHVEISIVLRGDQADVLFILMTTQSKSKHGGLILVSLMCLRY